MTATQNALNEITNAAFGLGFVQDTARYSDTGWFVAGTVRLVVNAEDECVEVYTFAGKPGMSNSTGQIKFSAGIPVVVVVVALAALVK